MEIDILPTTLEEAFEILKTFYKKDLVQIESLDEKDFVASAHFGAGMFLRNSWCLWWSKDHKYAEWPKEEPKLNAWFKTLRIWHADDMSSIILTSFHRHLKGVDLKLEEQAQKYISHWDKCDPGLNEKNV